MCCLRGFSLLVVVTGSVHCIGAARAQDFRIPKPVEHEPFRYADAPGVDTPESLRLEKPFQSGLRCGPNSLYILLKLCGLDVSYRRVLEQVNVGPKGSSLKQLKEAASHFGLSTEARKGLAPEDLKAAQYPLIVHLRSKAGEDKPEQQDHFVVITHVRQDGKLAGIDTTNGLYTLYSAGGIARNMSGYALVLGKKPVGSRLSFASGIALSGLLCVLVVANLVLRFRSQRPNGDQP